MRCISLLAILFLAACDMGPAPQSGPPPAFVRDGASANAAYFRSVARIEPVAERLCRQQNPEFPAIACDFDFKITTDPRLGINAFQSLKRSGQPEVTFTLSLLRTLRNDDEIAFILGHETAHQISRHIHKSTAQQQIGAVLLGGLVASTGNASGAAVDQAASLGALIGSRVYSKRFEREADEMATYIALRSGYDPILGAAPFARMETGSSGFLSTHPPSQERFNAVQDATARIRSDLRAGRPVRF